MSATPPETKLVPSPRGELVAGWRGDEHQLQLEAAREVGLATAEQALDSFARGFSDGVTLTDALDRALVLRGRTILTRGQFEHNVRPLFDHLELGRGRYGLLVQDGEFELRITAENADRVPRAVAMSVLWIWLGALLAGALTRAILPPAFMSVVWGLGLLIGGWRLRTLATHARERLASRLVTGLAMIAREGQLILPPAVKPHDDG